MNPLSLFISLSILFLFACDSDKKKEDKKAKEVYHIDELEFQVDTLLSDSSLLSYGSKAIPNYFILGQKITDSTVEAHIYADQQLFVIYNSDTVRIVKDSLLKDINQEYLSEALIEGLMPVFLNPNENEFIFEFHTRKPMESFKYAYELIGVNGVWRVQIID